MQLMQKQRICKKKYTLYLYQKETVIFIVVYCRYETDPEQFQEKLTESVRRSREVVYDPPQINDAHAIKFVIGNIAIPKNFCIQMGKF